MAAGTFEDAVDAHARGDYAKAPRLIRLANSSEFSRSQDPKQTQAFAASEFCHVRGRGVRIFREACLVFFHYLQQWP
jgi:hypothetical protein